ncbi:putative hydrophobin [Lactarius indigo]|nr:putative hydrophobin [Lactarius indigo]
MFAAASSATASATPLHRRGDGGYPPPYAPAVPRDQCKTVSNCCNLYTSSENPSIVSLATLLGVVLGPVEGVASGCTVLGDACNNQAVCCSSKQAGLINVGCSPISL